MGALAALTVVWHRGETVKGMRIQHGVAVVVSGVTMAMAVGLGMGDAVHGDAAAGVVLTCGVLLSCCPVCCD